MNWNDKIIHIKLFFAVDRIISTKQLLYGAMITKALRGY